jgi:3'-phosphoadenosine 5'-phosphosulfate sulfotransferase (PAPS reductase)/FAD synthetase
VPNPYELTGPAQICFSGGRTSGYMLHQLLEANGGLPDGCHVTFENTGKEREETLAFIQECSSRWQVPVTWLEWRGFIEGAPRVHCRFNVVDFATASRNGEPFALLNAQGMLPNPVARLCTINLKIRTGTAYMRSLGYNEWDQVMGIRADEPGRVSRMLAPGRDNTHGLPLLPLARANVSKADVLAFWRDQPFDLELDAAGDLGNCDLCFMKARHKIVRALIAEPERAVWWMTQENVGSGAKFRANRPPYTDLQREAYFYRRQYPLELEMDETDEAIVDCYCGPD